MALLQAVGDAERDRVDVLHRRADLDADLVVGHLGPVRVGAEAGGHLRRDRVRGSRRSWPRPPGGDLVGLARSADRDDRRQSAPFSRARSRSASGSSATVPLSSGANPCWSAEVHGCGRRPERPARHLDHPDRRDRENARSAPSSASSRRRLSNSTVPSARTARWCAGAGARRARREQVVVEPGAPEPTLHPAARKGVASAEPIAPAPRTVTVPFIAPLPGSPARRAPQRVRRSGVRTAGNSGR